MRNKLNKRFVCLMAVAVVLAGSLSVGGTMAYFTAFDTAAGGVKLDLGFTETKINENVVDGKKEITLKNTGDQDCYVRLKALTGDEHKDGIKYSGDSKWTPDRKSVV